MARVSDAVPQHRQRRTRGDWVMVAAQMRPPPEVHIHRKGYLVSGPALVLQRHSANECLKRSAKRHAVIG